MMSDQRKNQSLEDTRFMIRVDVHFALVAKMIFARSLVCF